MFKNESEFQELIHNNPGIVLSGIPEVDPNLCPDTPTIASLGREVSLASGPIDNLYIDTKLDLVRSYLNSSKKTNSPTTYKNSVLLSGKPMASTEP
jgi:hypothetical protein